MEQFIQLLSVDVGVQRSDDAGAAFSPLGAYSTIDNNIELCCLLSVVTSADAAVLLECVYLASGGFVREA